MTFTQNVKNELMQIKENTVKGKALLLDGLAYCSEKRGDKLSLHCGSDLIAGFFKKLLGGYEYSEKGKMLYITDKRLLNPVLPSKGDYESGIFLRGVFITCGVISNPENTYHLEINGFCEEKCKELKEFISERGISVSASTRKNKHFIYIKESERIVDFLTYIGAVHHSMEIMNAKILKDVRNNINRTVNCEAANIEKTAIAASRQIADIEYIYENKGEMYLPPELRIIAELRINNVEMSLKEMGEACEPKISRSGVNHRLKKISEIADSLRNSKSHE